MAKLRKTKEFYSQIYQKAMRLFEMGRSIKEVAELLGISYSCAYAWYKCMRKPKPSKVEEFLTYIRDKGPVPIGELRQVFPKHSELFHLAKQRGFEIKRAKLSRKVKGAFLWYYLPGQEEELKRKVEAYLKSGAR